MVLIPACSHPSAVRLSEATDALERVGLGRYEALVFVNLARAGAATAGEVARASGVNRVQTYRALESLGARGLVEVTLDRPRRYAARALNDPFQRLAEHQRARFILVDRTAILAFLIQDERTIRGDGETALWTNSPDFVKAHLEFFEKAWTAGMPAEVRLRALGRPGQHSDS